MDTLRLFRHHVHVKLLLLGLMQLVLVMGAVYGSAFLRFGGVAVDYGYAHDLFWHALLVGAVVIFSMQAMGLYDRHLRVGRIQLAVRIAVSFVCAAVVLSVIFYAAPSLYLGRGVMALATLIAFCLVLLTHLFAFSRFDNSFARKRVIIYGAGHNAASILSRLRRRSDWVSFQLLGCIPVPNEEICIEDQRVLRPEDDLAVFAKQQKVDEIIVAMDERRDVFPLQSLLKCRLDGIAVTDMLGFYERSAGKIKTDLLRPSWIIFSDGFSNGWRWRFCKRLLDVAAAGVLLAVTWPVMLIAAALIKREDGWRAPVLYRQVRVGQNGRHYTILKFRSMSVNAETGTARWATKNDTRVTRIGYHLRKYRIDELPQLVNVLRGHMSFVGPRPERPEFVEELARDLAFYDLRQQVKPGITGWAQLGYPYGASNEDALEKLQYDLYYIKNGSLFLDLVIILGTVEVVLFRKGSR